MNSRADFRAASKNPQPNTAYEFDFQGGPLNLSPDNKQLNIREYTLQERTTTIRISDDVETVTAEGLGDESLDFALKLQSALPLSLSAIDMDYSFNIKLSDYKTVADIKSAISN